MTKRYCQECGSLFTVEGSYYPDIDNICAALENTHDTPDMTAAEWLEKEGLPDNRVDEMGDQDEQLEKEAIENGIRKMLDF